MHRVAACLHFSCGRGFQCREAYSSKTLSKSNAINGFLPGRRRPPVANNDRREPNIDEMLVMWQEELAAAG